MRVFRYLSPSPTETRAFYVFALGAFLGQLMAFSLAMISVESGAKAIAFGGGLAILARFGMATWQFDTRRRRARNASIELQSNGIRITNANGGVTFVRFDEVEDAQSKGGRLQLQFRGKKWGFGAREVENGLILTQEILKKTVKTQAPSNFIPLEPM
ncbi:hypothetical protein EON80_06645 [bacterium]|nr:MAG: hypothetical protein EON80_06645 [bacterium]